MTDQLRNLRQDKLRLLAKRHKSREADLRYREIKTTYNKLTRKAKFEHLKANLIKSKHDSRRLWQHLKEFTNYKQNQSSLANSFNHNNIKLTSNQDIAQGFNNFFSTITDGLIPTNNQPSKQAINYLNGTTYPKMTFTPVNSINLRDIVESMQSKTSSGFDLCSNKILKVILPAIEAPLLHLINKSLTDSTFPAQWKLAKIVPIFKSGDKSLFTNHRPISLLPTISKIIEKIVQKQVEKHLLDNDIIYHKQFGFRPKHETTQAVITLLDNISQSANNPNLAVFMDIRKAFDVVNHPILIEKLKHYGLPYEWFQAYLNNRQHYTSIRDAESTFATINTGVPQGSVLGPLLFKIYINDMPRHLDLNTILFADDTTYHISANTTDELIKKTNYELNKAHQWFQANKLTLHPGKTMFMVFSKNQQIYNNQIIIDSHKIMRIGEEEDIKTTKFVGIRLDENLKWNHHIEHVNSKVASGAYLINKNKNFLPLNIRKLLYNALVRPHLEYGICAWATLSLKLEKKINIMQNRAIRAVAKVKNHRSHTTPLYQTLKLLKFTDLKNLNLLKMVFKATQNQLPGSLQEMFISKVNAIDTRSSNKILFKLPLSHKHPTHRAIQLWNDLDNQTQMSVSIKSFIYKIQTKILIYYIEDNNCPDECHACKGLSHLL